MGHPEMDHLDEGEVDVLEDKQWQVRFRRRNKGITRQFEEHVHCTLATGATARQVQDMLLLDGNFMLAAEDAMEFCRSIPQIRWFQAQREGLGIESYLYSFMRIAGASRVVQWGFDESTLDGVSCLNQWALLEFPVVGEGGGEAQAGLTVVTLECAGVLPNGESAAVVRHIELAWERGRDAVEALRATLEPEERDELCPIVNGGVNLHKLYGVMHDTCNGANLVAKLMLDLQEKKKKNS